MLKKMFVVFGIGLVSLTTALPIAAQETATLALRNGERPSGELIDLNASGFTLRINGQERQFPAGEVAAVEFVGGPLPGDAQARVNAGQAVVLLRNGQVIEGRLSDIGGTRPLRLTVDTPSGQREFTSNDVAQLHLAAMHQPAPAATTGQTAQALPVPSGARVTIPANQAWVDSGVTVRRGMQIQFTSTGDVMISPSASSGVAGSTAVTSPTARYPLQGAPAGAVIGRVGNSAPFLIGSITQPIEMPANGRLMLGINDDQLNDNTGNYTVIITPIGGRR